MPIPHSVSIPAAAVPGGVVSVGKLYREVLSVASLGPKLAGLEMRGGQVRDEKERPERTVAGGVLEFKFSSALTEQEAADLAEAVAAHDGAIGAVLVRRAHLALVGLAQAIGIGWAPVGGAVCSGLGMTGGSGNAALGKIGMDVVASVNTVAIGGTPQIRVTELSAALAPVVIGQANLPATAGAWEEFVFQTTTPIRPGLNTYLLEGRLNGAASASVRFAHLALLETK